MPRVGITTPTRTIDDFVAGSAAEAAAISDAGDDDGDSNGGGSDGGGGGGGVGSSYRDRFGKLYKSRNQLCIGCVCMFNGGGERGKS